MLLFAARILLWSGVLHVVYGLVRFREPLLGAVGEGFVGRFMHDDTRRLAFWFVLIGPLLTLLGQLSLRALESGDLGLVRIVGTYLLAAAAVGVLAFPKSPLWSLLPIALIFVFAGRG